MLRTVMQRLDVRASVNAVNAEGETALLRAARMEKWETVRDLLGSERVADEVDVHIENKAGNTCLVLIMLARFVPCFSSEDNNKKKANGE